MLINHATGMPVLLTFTGVDNVLGSHYDQYVFEYDKVETTIDYSVFDIYQSEHVINYVLQMCSTNLCACMLNLKSINCHYAS